MNTTKDQIRESAARWSTPHIQLVIAVIRALRSNAPPTAWTRSMNATHSRIADPSVVVRVARFFVPTHPRFPDTYRNHLIDDHVFARAFIYDFHHTRQRNRYRCVFDVVCCKMSLLVQEYGIRGSIREALFAQWGQSSGVPIRYLYGFGGRVLRRHFWATLTADIVKGYADTRLRKGTPGFYRINTVLWFNTRWGSHDLYSEKQAFDLLFDMLASVPAPRRRKFIEWLASRVRAKEHACSLNTTLMAKLRQAFKNEIRNLSLEEINRRFPC